MQQFTGRNSNCWMLKKMGADALVCQRPMRGGEDSVGRVLVESALSAFTEQLLSVQLAGDRVRRG